MKGIDSSLGSSQSFIPPILASPRRRKRLSGRQPDSMRYWASEGPIEPSKTRAHRASGQPERGEPAGGMNNCLITELPSLQCSHCTGAEDQMRFDPDVDYQTGKRYDSLLPEARIFSALNDGPRRKATSDRTVQSEHRRTTTTGLYNKTDLTYGGDDNHVEYLSLDPADSS